MAGGRWNTGGIRRPPNQQQMGMAMGRTPPVPQQVGQVYSAPNMGSMPAPTEQSMLGVSALATPRPPVGQSQPIPQQMGQVYTRPNIDPGMFPASTGQPNLGGGSFAELMAQKRASMGAQPAIGMASGGEVSPLDGYSFLDEGDNHFMIQTPAGVAVPIPTKGIEKDLADHIRSLPPVAKPEDNRKFEPDPKELSNPPGFWEGLFPNKPMTPEQEKAWEGNISNKVGGAVADFFPAHRDAAGNPIHGPVNAPPVVPSLAPPVPVATPTAPTPPEASQVAQPIKMEDPMAGYNSYFAQARKGMQGAADAQALGAKQAADAAMELQTHVMDMQKRFADERTALDNKQAELEKGVANQTIKPNDYWDKQTGVKGTSNKVLSLMGLFLGGLSQSRTGVNPAQQVIDKAVQDNIDAQKENLNTSKSLLRTNLEKYQNLKMAEDATRLDMMNMYSAQLKQIESSTTSEMVKANAQTGLADLGLKQEALKDQLAQARVAKYFKQAVLSGANVPDELVAQMPEQDRAGLVKVRNPLDEKDPGKWMQAKTPEAAKEVEKIQGSVKTINGLIDQMIQMRKDAGGGSGLFGSATAYPGTWTDKKQAYDQLHGAAMEELRSLSSGARLNEGTIKYLSEILPPPGSFKITDEELIRSKGILAQKLGNEMAGRIYNAPTWNPLAREAEGKKP